ncbi:hypothetical protein [Candidatus Hodgkinia cicadicola]|uniref:hypothetical protein n=1 Tax=Candidatus Hodgkinia cicadicola TaxID=573658 RepID=UPI001788AD91
MAIMVLMFCCTLIEVILEIRNIILGIDGYGWSTVLVVVLSLILDLIRTNRNVMVGWDNENMDLILWFIDHGPNEIYLSNSIYGKYHPVS